MGLFETLKKRLTPEMSVRGIATPTAAQPAQYPRAVLTAVSATWTTAMALFADKQHQIGLAQMYCLAVRERLVDELEGALRPSDQILRDLLKQMNPPPAAAQAFTQLSASDFDASYNRLRMEYANRGVDLEQMADALIHVVDVVRYVAHLS